MKAFTLVEILITVAILAVIATIGTINLLSYRERQDLSFTAKEIVGALRDAQNRSISQESGTRWGVYFDNTLSPGYFDIFSGVSHGTSTVVSRTSLPAGIKFTNPASGSTSTVVFSPLTGLPQSQTAVIISLTRDESVSTTITVYLNGNVAY